MSTLATVFGYGLLSARAAASVAGRFYYATDTSLMYRDNGSTWDTLALAGAGTGTVTTVKDEGTNLSTAVTSVDFVGAGVTATGTTAVTVTIPGGGYLGTRTEATLGADVTITTANAYQDGPTTTPTAGVYDVWGRISFLAGSVGGTNTLFYGRLVANGGTVYDELSESLNSGSTNGELTMVLSARITADGTNPVKISGSSALSGVDKMKRDPQANSSGLHRATLLVLIRAS